ncbi:MAG: thymidylate synthase [Nanoarchaeota archaeon]|nr:thymidylate synthase [Nanoarchaeota archaeon]
MKAYLDLQKRILVEGDVEFEPRTKTYTIGISGHQCEYNLSDGFPMITTKNVPPRLPFEELFWKLRGERNVKGLVDRNVHIWTANAFDKYLTDTGQSETIPKHTPEWNEQFKIYSKKLKEDPDFAKASGDLGPVYGNQWRHWPRIGGGEVDQLENLIKGIKKNPGSRYHVLSAWNVGDLKEMALGPCPFWHQFTVYGDQLDLHMVLRSCDTYLGIPFNIAQDSLLAHMVAKETDLIPRKFIHTTINTHIYLGVEPRAIFWSDEDNVIEFKRRIGAIKGKEEYLGLKEWYINNAPEESEGNEGKDHVPFVLEQLSKEPRCLPDITIRDIPLLEAIKLPVKEVVSWEGYDPHKWDSKAEMAA